MELKVDGAYYRDGSARGSLAGYLGDEIATYAVGRDGVLKLSAVIPLPAGKVQPHDQTEVQLLIGPRNLARRSHRLFFQVVLSQTGAVRKATLFSARSPAELDQFTQQFTSGSGTKCAEMADRCAQFPEWSTASVSITIRVNGIPETVAFASAVGSVAPRAQHVSLIRASKSNRVSIPIDARDPESLRFPLVNGDEVEWD